MCPIVTARALAAQPIFRPPGLPAASCFQRAVALQASPSTGSPQGLPGGVGAWPVRHPKPYADVR